MERMRLRKNAVIGVSLALMLCSSACATFRSIFGSSEESPSNKPIADPFGAGGAGASKYQGIVLRGKNPDGQTMEVELPGSDQAISDFVVPVQGSGQWNGSTQPRGGRAPASYHTGTPSDPAQLDDSYRGQESGFSDREITGKLPNANPENEWKRREIEMGLGVVPSDEDAPSQDQSYLAAIDYVKQLFRSGRFEAGLLELDKMVRTYPTDPKIYEMRGTLLDRLGYPDLALKSWDESLRINPKNGSLREYVNRKRKKMEWKEANP